MRNENVTPFPGGASDSNINPHQDKTTSSETRLHRISENFRTVIKSVGDGLAAESHYPLGKIFRE